MALNRKISVISICFVLIVIISQMKPTHAECCRFVGRVFFPCYDQGSPQICKSKICMDGSVLNNKYYCGVGGCNIFGCRCDGGCRKNAPNNLQTAVKLWEEKHGKKASYYRPNNSPW